MILLPLWQDQVAMCASVFLVDHKGKVFGVCMEFVNRRRAMLLAPLFVVILLSLTIIGHALTGLSMTRRMRLVAPVKDCRMEGFLRDRNSTCSEILNSLCLVLKLWILEVLNNNFFRGFDGARRLADGVLLATSDCK
ncbi:hypothetical protein HC62_15725 [Acetobacter tropicalis]|uniref:Uncharacterized protein n=1 Tax=Acetobacter tropicalis TaxID=104102 RepID=A0A252A2T3_9PROT|nr:hypothetical protein HC62_15725 [Acetobacter tropicalis]